ncbi:alpha/beta hydrolase-fold protein [Bartonella sp. HY406]|uniref:alpha/beta hydrolase-fold protein n=1 Tax=Bartonella sp. HY406 TaxID=2979331 RepID=UPI0021C623AB|nr:alpha/beta hydrolase-fold protein [Bartonella sp. HY406]UXN02535.1 alpha/beta hydrolase-fold protein [Bartonella sp. HY406]
MVFKAITLPLLSAILVLSLPVLVHSQDLLLHEYLKKGESRILTLSAQNGDYVILEVGSKQGRFELNIIDDHHNILRQLASAQSGSISRRFILDKATKLELSILDEGDFSATARFLAPQPKAVLPSDSETYLSPLIKNLAKSADENDSVLQFWQQQKHKGTPLIEKGKGDRFILTFLYYGAKNNVRLFGAPSGDHEDLLRLGQSDLWYKSFEVPSDTRLTYQLAADVPYIESDAREQRMAIIATAKADPYNLRHFPAHAIDAYSQESIIELPSAEPQPFIHEQGAKKGKITNYNFKSNILKNERIISIYQSPNVNQNSKPLLLYVFDGREYQTKVDLPQILDNMIAQKAIGPIIAVFIENPDRETRAIELPANPDFADFMAKELSPFIHEKTGFTIKPSHTVLAGSSYGGLAALSAALRYPQLFGNVISLSGSYWWHPKDAPLKDNEYIASQISKNPKPHIKVFLSAGLFEGGHSGGTASILDANRHLRHVLTAKNIENFYHEYAGGHDYIVWQGAISDGLIALFTK